MRSLAGWLLFLTLVCALAATGSRELKAGQLPSEQLSIEDFESPKAPERSKPKVQNIPAPKRVPKERYMPKERYSKAVSSPSAPEEDTWTEPVTGMEFMWVPKGCYDMGCGSWISECYDDEIPVHKVCVDGFWMGKHEVTQAQWRKVMGNNPSHFQKGDDYPVEQVSWNEVKEFIGMLNSLSEGRYTVRLPTEAEWEYACRSGGEPEMFSGGDDVERVAWYRENSGGSTRLVNAPNGLGLIDMSGNVWEWCEDAYDSGAYRKLQGKNPVCTGDGSQRVVRGGSWMSDASQVRCGIRRGRDPDYRGFNLGFRLLRTRER